MYVKHFPCLHAHNRISNSAILSNIAVLLSDLYAFVQENGVANEAIVPQ